MAPIALNSVAPCRRAESRNVLAENRGSRISPAPQASEPIVEYAGALMWNSGSEVIIRSAAVSSIQYGNPSPAIAYARWVCMTSLDRPVVPDVGMSTAISAWLTDGSRGGPAAGAAMVSQPLVSSSESSTPSGGRPVRPASRINGMSPASVMMAPGAVWRARPASSAGALLGLADTVTAPDQASASQHSR